MLTSGFGIFTKEPSKSPSILGGLTEGSTFISIFGSVVSTFISSKFLNCLVEGTLTFFDDLCIFVSGVEIDGPFISTNGAQNS